MAMVLIYTVYKTAQVVARLRTEPWLLPMGLYHSRTCNNVRSCTNVVDRRLNICYDEPTTVVQTRRRGLQNKIIIHHPKQRE